MDSKSNYSVDPLPIKALICSFIPSASFENAVEAVPLLDQPASNNNFTTALKRIGRFIVFAVSVTFFTTVMIKGDTSSLKDNIILGLVCASGVLYSVYPILSLINLDFSSFRKVRRRFKVVGSQKGAMVATVVVLLIMAAVSLSLPIQNNKNNDNNNTTEIYYNSNDNNSDNDNISNIHKITKSTLWLRGQSYIGLICFLALLWATSKDRKSISWRTVWVGLLLQFLLALFILKTKVGEVIFATLSSLIASYFSFSDEGFLFLFGVTSTSYAARVFPAIIFFCATTELLYYYGILQSAIRKFGTFFMYFTGTSGAESIVAVASPYIGQGENAMLVRPFLKDFTNSEIHQVMTSGFATTSGAVLVGYIGIGVSSQILITAAIMSVPCSIVLSKMRYPEVDIPKTKGEIIVENDRYIPSSAFLAIGYGAKTGIKIVLIISALLVSVLSLLAAINAILGWFSHFFHQQLTLQLMLSYFFYPVAWLMGIEWKDVPTTSQILALKLVANEFTAFLALLKETHLEERTRLLVSYALCGFSNLLSIGIQVGILGSISPSRLQDFASLSVSAMLTGALSTCVCSIIIGMLQ